MSATASWWAVAGSAAAVAVASLLADFRRQRRSDLDRAGWVPWPLLQILAMILAAVAAALALKA
jgi:hypothetical protein